ALDDLGVVDLVTVDRAHPLVADPAAVGLVQLVEAEALRLGGPIPPHGDGDQAEGDRSLPDRLHEARPPLTSKPLRERRARGKATVTDQVNCTLAGRATKGGLASLGAARRRRPPLTSPPRAPRG